MSDFENETIWEYFLNIWIFGEWSNQFLLIVISYILILLTLAVGLVMLTVRLHQSNSQKSTHWQSLEAKWNPSMKELKAGTLLPQQLLEQVAPNERFFFVDYLMRHMPDLSPDAQSVLNDALTPCLDIIAARMEVGDEEQRARAVLTLNTLNFERYHSIIVKALDDNSPVVAMLASRALSDTGALEYLEVVLEKIDIFRNWSQSYLTSMLESLAASNPLKLRDCLIDKQRPDWIQAVILKTLSQLNCYEAIPIAVHLLESDADREVQAAALQLLAKLDKGGHKELIRQKCLHDNFVIRLHAIKALAQVGDTHDVNLLRQLLEDQSQWVALHAASALNTLGQQAILADFGDTEHPHANLALQTLYGPESISSIRLEARSPAFAAKVPQWLRAAYRYLSVMAWEQINYVLYMPETHPIVRQAIVQGLRSDAAPLIYQTALAHLYTPTLPLEPHLLVQIVSQMEPEKSLEPLSQILIRTDNPTLKTAIAAIFDALPLNKQKELGYHPIQEIHSPFTFEGLTDYQWAFIQRLLPAESAKKNAGIPHAPFRAVVNSIAYVMLTGCHWSEIPTGERWGKRTTSQRWLKKWEKDGTWERIKACLLDPAEWPVATERSQNSKVDRKHSPVKGSFSR